MTYWKINIGPAHPRHTGTDFTECEVWRTDPIESGVKVRHFTGAMAKRKASSFCACMMDDKHEQV